ncbi:restriction endonuclease (plasmid) [Rhizobium leguminosarum]|uniref:restriction endonuclease n=1 Tax=Rhizobium leguminosarum TaxID=384 RepID=UPI001030146D|nr:restriction endonuclease [Rhizobium leguminosarum]TAX46683.1 restriction endonuclease [Rhizobium leguminosarum]
MTAPTRISNEEYSRIIADIARLEVGSAPHPREAERILGDILTPILRVEGFAVQHTPLTRDSGLDFVGVRGDPALGSAERLGVEAKFYRRGQKVSIEQVRALIGAGLAKGMGRVILVSNCPFTKGATATIERDLPLTVELKALDDLRSWLELVREAEPDAETEVRIMLRELSERFARLIARDPGAVAHLEWRDVERIVAEVFDGLGFRVTLTAGSKDGGKDECEVAGKQATYYVEIKHWRSSTRVGADAVMKLLKVIVTEKKAGGLFLSTYGFTENAFEQLTMIEREKLRFGDQEKIVTLCRTYVKAKSGIWSPPENLTEVLFDGDAGG